MKKVTIEVTEYDIGDIMPLFSKEITVLTGMPPNGILPVFDYNLHIKYLVDYSTGKVINKTTEVYDYGFSSELYD